MTVTILRCEKQALWIVVLAAFFLFVTTRALARIPEPDNIIYGLPGSDVTTVTLKVDGQPISTYTMGDNPDAGPYYILRVPIDALDPQEEGTTRPGDQAGLYVNDAAGPAVTTSIGERGTVQKIHLTIEDADGDGLLDVEEIHELGTNPNSADTDGDTIPDGWEVLSNLNPNLKDDFDDPDYDTFANLEEYFALSDPLNNRSIPAFISVPLKKGFNIIAIPAEVKYRHDLAGWMPDIGDSTEIDKVMPYDSGAGDFFTMIPGDVAAESFSLWGGEGLIVYSKEEKDVAFSSMLCVDLDLKEGFNLVGIACVGQLTSFELLSELGTEYVISIQRYVPETGAFVTAGLDHDGQPVGVDFPIVPGEGYFIMMKQSFTWTP